MLEIEMKFPVDDFRGVVKKVREWDAERVAPRQEEDHYFAPPDRDFAKTDEALRLRRIGKRNVATYKGPKEAGPTKTRTEIEVDLAEGVASAEQFERFLEALRYRSVARVRKKRTAYRFRRGGFPMEVTLDEVTGVGRFVEVEIVAKPEKRDAAQKVLQEVAAALGLQKSERRSYLEMLLAKAGGQS
ncbi:MAG: class IV adenylate cyclase [Gemmataceae bacterium]